MQEKKLSNRICPDGMSVEEWQVALRTEAARESDFQIQHLDENRIWGDYIVAHDESTYRIAFRGVQSERNYCSCLDFRTSGLGTCKHIEAVILWLRQQVPGYPWGDLVYTPSYSSIFVSYKGGRSVKFSAGVGEMEQYEQFRKKYFSDENVLPEENYDKIDDICSEALAISEDFRCYEDVFEFIDGELSIARWKKIIQDTFPAKAITTEYAQSSQSQRILSELYEMLLNGDGVIVGESTQALRKEIIAMIEVVLQNEDGPALIIAGDIHALEMWKSLINRSPLAGSERVLLTSQEQFKISTRLPSGLYSFLYVEEADCLKDWNNIISKTLKKLTIRHLYMHLPTMSMLTPVQFSSISQHISPFILAPFHRFIREFRPAFPLSDTGENLPALAQHFVFTRNKTRNLVWDDNSSASDIQRREELVDNFIQAAVTILSDEQTVELLVNRLRGILKE